ncbi:MAG: ABC transporter permease [Ilumatobacteraceae bacterium]
MTTAVDATVDRPDRNALTEGRRVAWAARRTDGTHRVSGVVRAGSAAAAALIVLALWWVLAASGAWSEIILPTPAKVWHAFIQSVTIHDGRRGISNYYLWEHLWASLWRILRGVFWAFVIGAPIGLALGTWRPFELIAEPMISFLRSLPPLAYFSLLIIWFGIDDTSKVWLLFLAAFPPITLAVAAGVATVRTERINAALVLGATRWQLLRHTVLPSVLPDLITGLRVAVGFAWTTIVAAETSNGIPGIGGLAWSTKKELRSDIAILCVIVIGITAVLLDTVLRLAERRLVPWKGRA